MTDGPSQYPPPGAPPPEDPLPNHAGYAPPGAAPAAPPAGAAGSPWATYPTAGRPGAPLPGLVLGAAHKPGAFPLRPLTLGSIYDGAFRIIRFNPKATVGAAVMVTAVAMAIPVAITAVLTFTIGLTIDASADTTVDSSVSDFLGILAAYGSLILSLLLAQIGVILVTGMIAHVTRAAAVGRRLGLREAWDATRGKRWRLIGLATVINLAFLLMTVAYIFLWAIVVILSPNPWPILAWGVITVPAFVCLCCWLWVRFYYLPVPALMLEPVGVFGAIGRGWFLTGRQFWRTFGIALLTILITQVASSMLTGPVTIIGQLSAIAWVDYAALILVLTQAIALIISNAFVAPFVAAVTSVQYVDLRMRKEALDVELMREAGIITG
ncbi:hypothetical protein [Nocardioides sp. WS12]|uniref:hypothetical protein n=1 Tax=Nocardioides sp. WS12 TaxID=2486272 RepID=UPI0015FCEF2B|nr:hypothetical protein [Nocardioides sp. WS12]